MNDETKINYTRLLFGFLCVVVSVLLIVECSLDLYMRWENHKEHSTMFEDAIMKQPPVSFKGLYEEVH